MTRAPRSPGTSGTGYYVDPEQKRLVSWKEV